MAPALVSPFRDADLPEYKVASRGGRGLGRPVYEVVITIWSVPDLIEVPVGESVRFFSAL